MPTTLYIRRRDIDITVTADFDPTPVRGNAMASGDEAFDKAAEDEIIRRLDAGDVWAWAVVTVTVRCGDYTGRDTLGCCSYADEYDFTTGGYYEDRVKNAIEDLVISIMEDLPRDFLVSVTE